MPQTGSVTLTSSRSARRVIQVEPSSAAAAWEHESTAYLFCSVACMRRFGTDPAHYLTLSDDERHM